MRTERSGQAFVELAVGMFAIAFLAGILFAFADHFTKSLKVQNSMRSSAPQPTGEATELGPFLSEYLGVEKFVVEEKAYIPPASIQRE